MPQDCKIVTPSSFSYASMRVRGTLEPPQGTIRSELRSPPLARTCWSRAFQIVGTAPATVGRSASISFTSGSGCRYLSGITRLAPAITAAYGRPHAFAWNIGTTGSTRSCSDMANTDPELTAIECKCIERWLYTTPLGRPVVP